MDRFTSGIGAGLRLLMPAVDMTRFDFTLSEEGELVLHFAVFSKMETQALPTALRGCCWARRTSQ